MIFVRIANAWSDLPAAQGLAAHLRDHGLEARLVCTGAEEGPATAQSNAQVVTLALWSPAAATSIWVLREADAAAARDVLIEALLAAPRPARRARQPAPIDMRGWRNHESPPPGWPELLRRIHRVAAGKSEIAGALMILLPAAAIGITGATMLAPTHDTESAALQTVTAPTSPTHSGTPGATIAENQPALIPTAPSNAPQAPDTLPTGVGGPLVRAPPGEAGAAQGIFWLPSQDRGEGQAAPSNAQPKLTATATPPDGKPASRQDKLNP